ncbi:MAG: hypothetical protein ABEJ03_01925 [Candidatus Nanohaloarchaea archaeon]
MSQDDAEEMLSGTVDEVKDAIREAEDPDYENLLESEKEGEDRKTVKEFLEMRIGEEVEEEKLEQAEGSKTFATLSAGQALGIGLVAGIALGALGASTMTSGPSASQAAVTDDVRSLVASSPNRTVEVGQATVQHGMYYYNLTVTDMTANGTQTRSQELYVSGDGELLFPKVQSFILTSPINVQEALQRQENAPR